MCSDNKLFWTAWRGGIKWEQGRWYWENWGSSAPRTRSGQTYVLRLRGRGSSREMLHISPGLSWPTLSVFWCFLFLFEILIFGVFWPDNHFWLDNQNIFEMLHISPGLNWAGVFKISDVATTGQSKHFPAECNVLERPLHCCNNLTFWLQSVLAIWWSIW